MLVEFWKLLENAFQGMTEKIEFEVERWILMGKPVVIEALKLYMYEVD